MDKCCKDVVGEEEGSWLMTENFDYRSRAKFCCMLFVAFGINIANGLVSSLMDYMTLVNAFHAL